MWTIGQFVGKLLVVILTVFFFGNCFPANPRPLRILILGNSITQHNPAPDIGWTGNWGMAASEKDKDYIHLLMHNFKNLGQKVDLRYANIAVAFEERFWNYDSAAIEKGVIRNPDILVFRLGDNLNADSLKKYPINVAFQKLVNQVAPAGKTRIMMTSCFWSKSAANEALNKCATMNKWAYIDMSTIALDSTNTAIGQFENKGVANHPSDKGMMQIYLLINAHLQSAINHVEKQ